MVRLLSCCLLLLACVPALAQVRVDGRIDADEWADAQTFTDFRMTQPLSGEPSPYPTEALVLSTPEGLAVAFRNRTPAGIAQPRQKSRRDEEVGIDRVNVIVDFDGDGNTAYGFMITASNGIEDSVVAANGKWRKDWDGLWQHAVQDGQTEWTAEVLIPWHIAPMRKAQGERTIGLYLDRVVGSLKQRMAVPAVYYDEPQFIARFAQVKVAAHAQSMLAVTPYVVAAHDLVDGRWRGKAGGDLFWKPNGEVQLSATLNPDFGQVESDDLVVNFSAEETFRDDKRPFFIENQSLFDVPMRMDNSQLLYTRRVGAAADDGSGPADILGAVKFNGMTGALRYGAFAAQERGDAGRRFAALRAQGDAGAHTLGAMLTAVQRPWLHRQARVLGLDHQWRPAPSLTLTSTLAGSDVAVAGQHRRGIGATARLQKDVPGGWRHTGVLMHFGRDFQINDFGYLARNDFSYGQWEVQRRVTALPAVSAYSAHTWQGGVEAGINGRGHAIKRGVQLERKSQRRDGGELELGMAVDGSSWDDRILRGHGEVRVGAGAEGWMERKFARRGRWDWTTGAHAGVGWSLDGSRPRSLGAWLAGTWYASDALNIGLELGLKQEAQWRVWQRDTLLGDFRNRQVKLSGGLNYKPGMRHELRIKLQALGLQADQPRAWRVGADGRAQRSNDAVDPLSLRHLGFQVRYRYELAPLSDLYVVYGRGGYQEQALAITPWRQFGDAFSLRDDEQLLVKLAYRFEL